MPCSIIVCHGIAWYEMVMYSTVRYAIATVTVIVIVTVIVTLSCRLLLLVSFFRVLLVPSPFTVDAIGNLSRVNKNRTTIGMEM